MKPDKNWFVGVFKCFDHNQMAGSRICMSKGINLINSLLSAVHSTSLDGWAKSIQNPWFLVINTWNNINQLQRSGSYIRMLESWIWEGRIRAQILLEGHKSLSLSLSLSLCVYKIIKLYNFINFWESRSWNKPRVFWYHD